MIPLGNGAILQAFTSSGSLDISGDFNNITLNLDKNNPETTTFGKTTAQRISGIKDIGIDFAGFWNTGASTAFSWLLVDWAASTNTVLRFAPGGSVSGCPVFTGSFLLSKLNIPTPHNGPVAMSFSAQHAAGSLTSACVV